RHLNRFEIGEVKSLKRQIEKRALVEGVERRDIKTGHGGIRDIEFTIQFLQLLNGGGLPAVRTQNTLRAIERLQQAGILTLQEEALLTQNYAWLRKLEHRLQIMFDLQTHTLPDHEAELRKVALRMGYQEQKGRTPLEHFRSDLAEITAINRRILDHLLHAAFTDETETEVPPVVDLLFAPQPEAAELEQLLSPFGFRQARVAYDQLLAMAEEDSPFLPSRRCKHFLAAILPRLLKEIGQTPQPDTTIVSLRSVADALGAKGVLWELFHLQPNALALFVRLCAGADYLVSILRNNPGMIDELVDSLLMQGLPESEWLRAHLEDLLRGAEQLDPIIHSFRQAQQLRVGVQDLLGWAGVSEVTQALTAIADTCLERVARDKYQRLCERFGVPYLDVERRAAGYAILACGKQGGRELNYHSDLDLIFLYEGEGETQHANPDRQTSNQHFFSLWASEVTKFITHAGPYGRLYEIDARLRPTGKSGALAVSSEGLRRYFSSGQGQAWERLALCKSRVVVAEGLAQAGWEQLVSEAIAAVEWDPGVVDEIWQMRLRMQEAAPKWSLKRAAGGTVDVEFLVQLFLMRQMGAAPQMRTASTVDGLRLLAAEGFLQVSDAADLERAYLLLRSVETALRLSTEMPHVELVEQPEFLSKLTYLMRRDRAQQLLGEIDAARRTNRRLLEFYLDRLRG
ncbi:MAG: hypothetical protein LW697_12795, partial [Blastopirellula sp.]|nr:hypothetical protein [Blastopirellula sp.]